MAEQQKNQGFEVVKKDNRSTAEMPTVEEKIQRIPILEPAGVWPPPLYIREEANTREVYYMEHRWHSQWKYYDERAAQAKSRHLALQLIIGIGSVTVPVLVGIQIGEGQVQQVLSVITIVISLIVAIATAIENVMKYGDSWRNYRAATEELQREKTMYDTLSGPYRRSTNPFRLFVERCEGVIEKQNGRWIALTQQNEENDKKNDTDDILDKFKE